jgi:hypothetical protein
LEQATTIASRNTRTPIGITEKIASDDS